MNDKQYKTYLEEKKELIKYTKNLSLNKTRLANSAFFKPLLHKINAKYKQHQQPLFPCWEKKKFGKKWKLYTTKLVAINEEDGIKISLYKFIEDFINPSPFDIEEKEEEKEEEESKEIYCCGCKKDIPRKLVKGTVIYPNKKHLSKLNFYQCECGSYIGCHKNRERPLGNIPTKELKNARNHIHKLIDPLWKKLKLIKRNDLYYYISECLPHLKGKKYHTAKIKSVEEARKVYKACLKIKKHLTGELFKPIAKGEFIE